MPKKRPRPRKPCKAGRPGSDRGREPELMTSILRALREPHPLELLALVSGLWAVGDPRRRDPFQEHAPVISREELVDSFLAIDRIETTAALAVLAAFTTDELQRARIRRELAVRRQPLPTWLSALDRTGAPAGVDLVEHVLGDGDDYLIDVSVGGQPLTAIIYVDHNMGTVVKDAFVVPAPRAEVAALIHKAADDGPDTTVTATDPADARARISAAIEHGAMIFPPLESESWPAARPLVEWILAMLPAGGTDYPRTAWTDAQRARLARQVLASPYASGLGTAAHRDMLESILWFGTDYGPGDPLRWSAVAVELVLLDWIPRKIRDRPARLAVAPAVLRALVRYAHAERGIRSVLTDEVLAAIDVYEPGYQEAIRTPRLHGAEALLARMGALNPAVEAQLLGHAEDDLDDLDDLDDQQLLAEIMLDGLERAVGGRAALDALSADPLPEEDFAWAAVPADIHDRVREVLEWTDRCCLDLLDGEYATAARRVLADAASADPGIFRRKGRAETSAAAICWMVAKANGVFDNWRYDPARPVLKLDQVKDLAAYFGLGSASHSQRAQVFQRAIGVDPYHQYGRMDLGSPRYLTAHRRARLIELRDRYRENERPRA
ncbi:MAG: DUF6398 domain-containing protein [Sporichthyaceae bacterium]